MRVPADAIISITSDYDPITFYRHTKFECKYFISSRNEIPQAGDIIEADLCDQYTEAFVTNVTFDSTNNQVELEATVVESLPTPDVPPFNFDPSVLEQQLINIFKHSW